MNVVLIPSKTRLFTVVAASLFSLHPTTQFTRSFLDVSIDNLTSRFFLFHLERTISTFYSAAVLLCSLALLRIVEETLNRRGLVFIYVLYITSELSDVRLIAPSQQELL